MGEERFEQHLKQIVANISYEYQDGRLSAIQMLTTVVDKLPDGLLERHAQLLFLPQVLQLVNDDSKECREAVSACLSALLRRSSVEVLQSFHNYTIRWCSGEGPMQVASLQVFGIFVDTCRDFVQSNDNTAQWISRLRTLLQTPVTSDWEVPYFSLLCLEKFTRLEEADKPLLLTGGDTELWNSIVERLVDSHPWIKLASCRIVQKLLNSPASDSEIPKVLEETPGMLFEIIRNLCLQLNVEEEEQSEDSSENAIKTLTLALPLVKKRPDLCFTSESPHAGLRDPISWVLRRLSSIAKPKGRKRRMAVYKCFAAFCTRYPDVVLTAQEDSKQRQLYMELMLEPLHRSDLEASNELENPAVLHKASFNSSGQETAVMTESSLAKDVLQLIEEGCADSPESFLLAYAAVKSRARDKKDDRKVQVKAEAVQDPMGAALKKSKKHLQERQRLKRRVEDRRQDRGAQKKRRNHSD
jgi:U3 small nucleolar RNA-associated protein 20